MSQTTRAGTTRFLSGKVVSTYQSLCGEAGSTCLFVPHPDTEPAAIAAAQRADVLAAHARGCDTPEGIGAAVLLDPWTVRRRLHELGLGPAPATRPAKPRTPAQRAAKENCFRGRSPRPKGEVRAEVAAAPAGPSRT